MQDSNLSLHQTNTVIISWGKEGQESDKSFVLFYYPKKREKK